RESEKSGNPAMPITDVEPIAVAEGMMAAMRRALPRRPFPASRPLPRHPPLADELGSCRIREVDDADDVAEIPVHFRRAVDVAAIEGETMHPATGEARDAPRIGGAGDIGDTGTTPQVRDTCAQRQG